VRDQDALVLVWIGVDSEYELTGEVLGGVGHQAVLPGRNDQILWLKYEAGQVGTIDPCPAPGRRDGAGDGLECRL
jgi:hypothetical protein